MDYVSRALEAVADWRAAAGPMPSHPALTPDPARFEAAWAEFGERMAGSYPFHHPRYAGQMLKPPHPVAIAAYTAALHVNANNHALDGGPVTSELEVEVMRDLATMFGFPDDALGHLTSSGTIANLEALWVARELHPDKAIAFGTNAHYTHSRMCAVLGVEGIATDDIEAAARSGKVGTIVVTAGTTGLGTVDDVRGGGRAARALRRADPRRRRLRRLLHAARRARPGRRPSARSRTPTASSSTRTSTACSPTAAARCCSATRASGASTSTTRRTPTSRRGDLHLGEISLECSRAGAAAAALWLTLRSLDLEPILAAGVRAARAWAALLRDSDELRLHVEPELDIVSYFPRRARCLGDRRRQRARARRRHDRPTTRSTCRRCGSTAPRSPPRTRTSRWTPTASASCAAC